MKVTENGGIYTITAENDKILCNGRSYVIGTVYIESCCNPHEWFEVATIPDGTATITDEEAINIILGLDE